MRELVARASALHRERYGSQAQVAVAPGRVNLIGEHTDYNDGFVLPMAIDRYTAVAFSPRDDRIVRGYSAAFDAEIEFDLGETRERQPREWSAYFKGIAFALLDRGIALEGCDLTILADVPLGSGLSSSASFEIAVGTALLANAGQTLSTVELALAGQASEHRYVGIRCGIMDQLAVASAEAGHALLIDCRSLETQPIAMPARWCVAVCDSLVRHELAGSTYNERREDCERAVAMLAVRFPGVRALRDVDIAMLDAASGVLEERVYRRALHVVEENVRTLSAADALRTGDGMRFGELMRQSHASLRDLYEVTIPELDELAEICAQVDGVYGARMTGGGFGGSVVALLERDAAEELVQRAGFAYYAARDERPAISIVEPASGALLLSNA